MTIFEKYSHWIENSDPETADELLALEGDDAEINDRFYCEMEFGTAGIRGVIGAGSNRMNRYTVAKATEGYAKYILSCSGTATEDGVVISYDNRHCSRLFAEVTAGVLAANGIKAYIFSELRPTPELSFAVRYLGCFGGVMITASHNPPEYNGYKLYDSNGCQLVPHLADAVSKFVGEVEDELKVNCLSIEEAGDLVEFVLDEIDEVYYEEVLALQFDHDGEQKAIRVVYTPEHGTGNIPVRDVLDEAGYTVLPVLSQCEPDPDFSGTKSPNPEMTVAYDEAIELMKKLGADLAIATDPDCDRLGAVINCGDDDFRLMTGNQSGAVILHYILTRMTEEGSLPENPVMINTVVTSPVGDRVAESFGVEVEKCLTGFKFIGDKIEKHNSLGDKKYVFGYEESYGCLIGDFARDKDAVQASLMICEAAAYYKKQGKTLIDVLEDIFERLGYYVDSQTSTYFPGIDGNDKMAAILTSYRENPPTEVAGVKVQSIDDFLLNPPEDFVPSNVLRFNFEDGSFVAVRPSGTEPKCKVYYCIAGKTKAEATDKMMKFKEFFDIK